MTTQVLTKPTTSLMTADEFYEFVHQPENRNCIFELDRGKVVEMSRPGQNLGCHGITAQCLRRVACVTRGLLQEEKTLRFFDRLRVFLAELVEIRAGLHG